MNYLISLLLSIQLITSYKINYLSLGFNNKSHNKIISESLVEVKVNFKKLHKFIVRNIFYK